MMLRDAQQLIKPTHPRVTVALPATAAGRGAAIPFALTLVLSGLFIPVELSFYVVGLRFTVVRLIFLVLTPVLLSKLARKVSTGSYRFVLSDLFVIMAGFWMIFAASNIDGLVPALNHAGPDALEFCIGYMTTRILLTEHGQALSFIDLLCRIIAVVALIGLLDPLTNTYFTHALSAQLEGRSINLSHWEDAYRLGLLRAAGPIEHPILYGFICGVGVILALSIPVKARRFVIISCATGLILAFSSAAVFSVCCGVALLIYDRIMFRVPHRWIWLVALGAIAIGAAFLISNSPVGFIISHFIYSPSSGYYREWTWYSVMSFVSQSPWYGLGYGLQPDDINHSINSLWLVSAIHFGFPGAVLVALSLIGAASLPVSGRNINLTSIESKLGTTLGIIIFLIIYVAFTVHLWGIIWILTGLLIGVRAHLGELGQLRLNKRGRYVEGTEFRRASPKR